MSFLYPLGLSRNPTTVIRNTVTLASATVVGLTIIANVANQALVELKDYASNLVFQSTGSGTTTASGAFISRFNSKISQAFITTSIDKERLWEVSKYGAIGVGTGATPFGSNGDCLKSGGGSESLMSFGSCGGSSGGSYTGSGATNQLTYWTGAESLSGADILWDDTTKTLDATGSGTFTGRLGIGTAGPTAPLHLLGSASDNPLIILTHADYTGTTAFLGFDVNLISRPASSSIDVDATAFDFAIDQEHDIANSTGTQRNQAVRGEKYLVRDLAAYSGTTQTDTEAYAIDGQVTFGPQVTTSGTFNASLWGQKIGIITGGTYNNASGTYRVDAIGQEVVITGGGTFTAFSALTQNFMGWKISVSGVANGTTTAYGININQVSGADTNYPLYSSPDQGSYMRGSLAIGSTTNYQTASELELRTDAATVIAAIFRGASSQTADLQQWNNSANAVLSMMDSKGNMGIRKTNATGASLVVGGTMSGNGLVISGSGTQAPLLVANSTVVEVNQTLSGKTLVIGSGSGVVKIMSNSAVLDFANLASIGCEDLTMTVTGAADGDTVSLAVPNGSVVANSSYSAWVSSANTVTVRFCALVSGDPASGTFRVDVTKYQ